MALEVPAITAEIAALRRSLAKLEEPLAANESWRALVQLERRIREGRPLEVIDARAMKARLESTLALEPAFRSWRRLSDVVAEIEGRLQQQSAARVDWAAIAARSAATSSGDGGAASFRTRFRAKLNSPPRPSIADLLSKARGLGLPGPDAVIVPVPTQPGPAAPPRPSAENAVTLLLGQLLANAEAQAERERSQPLAAVPSLRVLRLAERLADTQAEAQDDIADGASTPPPPTAPAQSSGPEIADVPASRPSEDSVARLAAIETEVDALVLSMGGNASIPPMPLAARAPVMDELAVVNREPAAEVPTESAPMPVGEPPADRAPGSDGREAIESFEAELADAPEAEVVIVSGPSPIASAASSTGDSDFQTHGAPLGATMRTAPKRTANRGFSPTAYRGRIEEAVVDVRPPGSAAPAIPDGQSTGTAEESAVARFLALLNGRQPT